MYELHELTEQNKMDFWSMMYSNLSKEIISTLGRGGEKVIRESIRRYAKKQGEKTREELRSNKININLDSVFKDGIEYMKDPRFRYNVQEQNEEVFIVDVITCPIASIWDMKNTNNLGRMFCEEFHHAYSKEYSFGISQTNLTKSLTHKNDGIYQGDNHCRIAIYMREANLPKELREICFHFDSIDKSNKKNINNKYLEMWLDMILSFYEVAKDNYKEEGILSISNGLRKLAFDDSEYIKKRADMTGNRVDEDYVNINHTLGLNYKNNDYWNADNYYFKEFISKNFSENFAKFLGIYQKEV